jgi:hypothetical protein
MVKSIITAQKENTQGHSDSVPCFENPKNDLKGLEWADPVFIYIDHNLGHLYGSW